MVLTPEIEYPLVYSGQQQPSRTYKLDIETGEISGMIDGLEAVHQFISKAIHTRRYAHPIYSPDYGCEIKDLFGKGYSDPYMESEIIRMVTEALIYDDRIDRVYNFSIESIDDEVHISFMVETFGALLEVKEVI